MTDGLRQGAAGQIDDLAGAFWEAYLDTEPVAATALGEPGRDDRLPDLSPGGRRGARARFATLREAIDAVPAGPLEGGAAVTRSALRDAIDEQLTQLDSGLAEWNVDTLDGIPVALLNIADIQPTATPAARAALVARWQAMARLVDDHVANLRRGLRDGRTACAAPVDRVTAILADVLGRPDSAWPLALPARAAASDGSLDTATRERFTAAVEAAVRDHVRPAFTRLHETLVTEIRPHARPVDHPGLLHVTGGAAAYAALARMHTSLDTPPETLHRIGVAEIERIDAETEVLAGRVLGTPTRAAAVAALRADPGLHFTTRAEVEAAAERSLARANAAIPAWFGRLPQAPCEVIRMGTHEEDHSTIAFYRWPAADGSRPGQYVVNTGRPTTRARYEAEALAYHEAVPGHHLQVAIAQELPGLPAFRRHLGPTAYMEGWALYVERLADEMGLYTGDLDRIGVLSFDAWRAARLVVDTGLHALGWTRRQAIDFMLEHTALAPDNIANEVDRYIVMPGQALAYKVGQLELLRLRADAGARLGNRFDIRAFHDAVLGSGALALPSLRGVVEAWVQRTAGVA